MRRAARLARPGNRRAQEPVAQGAGARRRAQGGAGRARQGEAHAAALDVAHAVGGDRGGAADHGGEEAQGRLRHGRRALHRPRQVPHRHRRRGGHAALPGRRRHGRDGGDAAQGAAEGGRGQGDLHAAQPAEAARRRLPVVRGLHPDRREALVQAHVRERDQGGLPARPDRAHPRGGQPLLPVARPRLRDDRGRPGEPQGRDDGRLHREPPLARRRAGRHPPTVRRGRQADQGGGGGGRGARGGRRARHAAARRAAEAGDGRAEGDRRRGARGDRPVGRGRRGGGGAGSSRAANAHKAADAQKERARARCSRRSSRTGSGSRRSSRRWRRTLRRR